MPVDIVKGIKKKGGQEALGNKKIIIVSTTLDNMS